MANRKPAIRRSISTVAIGSALMLCGGCSLLHHGQKASYDEAAAAFAKKDYTGANTMLIQLTQDGSNDPRVLFLAGQVALQLGQAARAEKFFEDLQRQDAAAAKPQYTDKLRPLMAKAQLNSGNPLIAQQTIGAHALDDPIACEVSVRAQSAAGDFAPAMQLLDQCLAKFPHVTGLMILDGVRAQALGRAAKADAIARAVMQQSPDDIDALIFGGQWALSQSHLAEAKSIFEAAHKLQPGHQTPMLALATIARDMGDKAGEKDWIDKARAIDGTGAAGAAYAAELAFDAGHTAEAGKMLEPFDDANPGNAQVQLLKGLVAAKLGDKPKAIEQLTGFFAHGGDDGRGRMALAVLLAQKGDKAGAWKVLKPLADAANAGAAPLQLASMLAIATNDPAKATYATRAAAASKADPDAQQMIAAGAAINAADWKKADAIYATLLTNPRGNQVVLLNNAAFVKTNLGDLAGAVALGRRALALAPGDPIVMDTLGWALFKSSGATPEARQLLQRAVNAQPGNGTIRAHAMAVQAALGGGA